MDEKMLEKMKEAFGLVPLEKEGGLYKQTIISDEVLEDVPGRDGKHRMYTVILYLLKGEGYSRMHRLPTDEVFHFYMGDPVEMLQLHPDGSGEVITMGQDFSNGEKLQVLVPRNSWQGTRLKEGSEWALLGTTMAPGYEDWDYEDGNKEELQKQYPAYKELLEILAGEEKTE